MLLDVVDDHPVAVQPGEVGERVEHQAGALELVLEVGGVDQDCEVTVERELDVLLEDRELAPGVLVEADLADPDAADNYRVVLRFRDVLIEQETLEAAYLAIVTAGRSDIPPLFVEQLVHAILRNILEGCRDPMRVRAAELFFREQNVSLDDGRVMLADEEVVDMYAQSGGMGALGQLLVESATPMRQVELDVLHEDNTDIYWSRSDRFDTVIDFRFTQPALDAFARVLEAWVSHFLGIRTRIQPMQSIRDERWSWHLGLDADSTRILNGLYEGREVPLEDLERIIGLFRMEIRDTRAVIKSMRNKPVYLGLAMTPARKLRMKPQNLLTNLPLAEGA